MQGCAGFGAFSINPLYIYIFFYRIIIFLYTTIRKPQNLTTTHHVFSIHNNKKNPEPHHNPPQFSINSQRNAFDCFSDNFYCFP